MLLVHDDAVRIFQDRLKIPVRIFHADLPMLTGDEFGDELHGTRTVQRIDGNDVLECRRLELLQHSPHARGLQLEHAGRLSAAQHLVRCRIVVRNKPEIGCAARLLLDPVHATLDNGQGAQPQKIHFKQADRFQVLHGVLRKRRTLAARLQRDGIGQRVSRNHNTGGVSRGVPRHAFHFLRHIQQPLDPLGPVIHRFQVRAFLQRTFNGHP
ncbi:hypothetical protein D3C74_350150 [compost metagenome]